MLAYNNNKKIKQEYLKRVKNHQKADELVHGRYWDGGKGCAVGCTIHSSQHIRYETELGIPQVIAHLEDRIFEGLSLKASQQWPLKFLTVIKPGADLSMVWPRFCRWMLGDKKVGMIKYAATNNRVVAAINQVLDIYDGWINKGVVDKSAAESAARSARSAAWSAESAARSAAESAAWSTASAARSAAESATESAAWSAASAARSAAESAAWSAAWSAAKEKHYLIMSKKLLQFLKEAPITKEK